jgi:hypothetical protein
MIGFNMNPTGSSPSAVGVDSCAEVGQGDQFDVDVFVTNLPSLTHFELRVDYDATVVSLDSADFDYLLVKNGGNILGAEIDEEKPGRKFIAAANATSPSDGSGTLARLHMTALKQGTTGLAVTPNPPYAPRLDGTRGVHVGDSNGDGYWDGQLSQGKVAVESSCGQSPPVITPAPTVVPTPTAHPGEATPTPGGATPDPSGQTSEPTQEPQGGDGGTQGNDGGSPTSPDATSSPIVGNIGGASEATSAPGNGGGGDSDTGSDGVGGLSAGSGGGGTSDVAIIAVILALMGLAAGAAVLVLRRATTRE